MSANLHVRVNPRSSKSGIVVAEDCSLTVKIRSAPVDGAANRELIRLIADCLNVPPSSIQVARGAGSRNKRLVIESLSQNDVNERVAQLRLVTSGTTT